MVSAVMVEEERKMKANCLCVGRVQGWKRRGAGERVGGKDRLAASYQGFHGHRFRGPGRPQGGGMGTPNTTFQSHT